MDYVLDIVNTGLLKVLQDGTNTYLNGVNRVAQSTVTQTESFLPKYWEVYVIWCQMCWLVLIQTNTLFGISD